MKIQEMWKEENARIMERYDLAMGRIREMADEDRTGEPFRSYFLTVADFAGQIGELAERQMRGELYGLSLEELK